MHDESAPDPSSSPSSSNPGGEIVSEQELDALLNQAAELAASISSEVGVIAESGDVGHREAAPPLPAEVDAAVQEETAKVVEAGLDGLDELLEQTSEDIGAPDEPVGAVSTDAEGPVATATHALPTNRDVEASFEDATDPTSSPLRDSSSTEALTQPVSTTEVASRPPADTDDLLAQDLDTQPAQPQGNESSEGEATSPPKPPRWRQAVRRNVERCAPAALLVCNLGVRMLEAMDRPTQRLGPGPRRLIGWLGIATIGTSLILLTASFF